MASRPVRAVSTCMPRRSRTHSSVSARLASSAGDRVWWTLPARAGSLKGCSLGWFFMAGLFFMPLARLYPSELADGFIDEDERSPARDEWLAEAARYRISYQVSIYQSITNANFGSIGMQVQASRWRGGLNGRSLNRFELGEKQLAVPRSRWQLSSPRIIV